MNQKVQERKWSVSMTRYSQGIGLRTKGNDYKLKHYTVQDIIMRPSEYGIHYVVLFCGRIRIPREAEKSPCSRFEPWTCGVDVRSFAAGHTVRCDYCFFKRIDSLVTCRNQIYRVVFLFSTDAGSNILCFSPYPS